MAKRLSEKQKNEMIKCFSDGKTIDELSKEFKFTKLTISRNLKKFYGEKTYKELFDKNKLLKNSSSTFKNDFISLNDKETSFEANNDVISKNNDLKDKINNHYYVSEFMEITPLDYEIDNVKQKDLSSIPLSEFDFPKIVYIIVCEKIELVIKLLKDYPEWQFLSQDDLKRKTLQIYQDLKIARRDCKKEQKVIKVPNSNVFKIVAPLLISRGITRLVSDDILIAL